MLDNNVKSRKIVYSRAAYKKQGINIETTGWLNEPGITPRDIYRSNKVSKISIN